MPAEISSWIGAAGALASVAGVAIMLVRLRRGAKRGWAPEAADVDLAGLSDATWAGGETTGEDIEMHVEHFERRVTQKFRRVQPRR